jgi:hypothetical protein
MTKQYTNLENTIRETQTIIDLISEKIKNQTDNNNKNMKTTNQNSVHSDEINTK